MWNVKYCFNYTDNLKGITHHPSAKPYAKILYARLFLNCSRETKTYCTVSWTGVGSETGPWNVNLYEVDMVSVKPQT